MKIHHMLEMPKADTIAAALAQTQKEAWSAEEEEEDEARAGGHEGSASEEEFEHADGQDPLGEEDQEESEEEAAEEEEREDENAAAARVEMCRQAAQALVGAQAGCAGPGVAPGPGAAAIAANSVTHKKEYMAFVRLAKNAKRMPTSLQGEFSRDKLELFNLWLTAEKDVGKLQLLVKRKARAKGFNQPSCTVCSLELSLFVHVSLSC
jgi:hypothetical protein